MPRAIMSDRQPVSPSTPQFTLFSWVCLACRDRQSIRDQYQTDWLVSAQRPTRVKSYPQWCQHSDGGGSTVLDQGSGDDLQGLGHGAVRPLLDAGQSAWALHQALRHRHLYGSAPGQQTGLQQNITTHLHGVLKVPFHLLKTDRYFSWRQYVNT